MTLNSQGFSHKISLALFFAILFILLIFRSGFADSIPADFITGADVSELTAQENSGVRYFNDAGEQEDALKILADHGVNMIRLRIWNDPYDENGNGYGGGNCDTENAARLSSRAASYGIDTLLDFHYSDFWADPSRQLVPKAWKGMSLREKTDALYDFTRSALIKVLDEGGNVTMVQVGNEINNGMAGESDPASVAALLRAGSRAVHEVADERGLSIRVCIHLTDPQNTDYIREKITDFIASGVDFEAVGLSYYPYWHGSLSDIDRSFRMVRELGKDAFIAENSWPFTLGSGDGWSDVIGDDPGIYPVSPEGQAQELSDVCAAAANAGAEGVFYWGGIWTPVGNDVNANWKLWEEFGSGWASGHAKTYDPEHVGDSYGGCAWENQALFDFSGHPLSALDVYRQIAEGNLTYDPASLFPLTEDSGTNELQAENLVRNPGFEDEDRSMWKPVSMTSDVPYDYQNKANDAYSGVMAFHYWSAQDMDFLIEQTLTGLEPGVYNASVWSQGGDMKNASMIFYVKTGGQTLETDFMNTRWADWQNPQIQEIRVDDGTLTIGVRIVCGAKSWGTLDDFTVVRVR